MERQATTSVVAARSALGARITRNRWIAFVGFVLVATAAVFLYRGMDRRAYALRMTAGDALSHRHRIAEVLCDDAALSDLTIELVPTGGSRETLAKVAAGEIDVALVQGDAGIADERIRQVAILGVEPLHLFARSALAGGGAAALRGKRVNLSTAASGTRRVASDVMRFTGLEPGRDFEALGMTYDEVAALDTESMPDAVFGVSTLPWELGEELVERHGFRLIELPYGDALALRDRALSSTEIPAYAYGVTPAVPDRPLATIGTSLLLVAHHAVRPEAVTRLMEVAFDGDFLRHANLPVIEAQAVLGAREYALHDGTLVYLNRNEPLVTGEAIESVENLRSFMVSAAIAGWLLWRWYRRRGAIGYEKFVDAVTELELAALEEDRTGRLDHDAISRFHQQLTRLKTDAMERQAEGRLESELHMVSLLTHIADVRRLLDALADRLDANRAEPPPKADDVSKVS